MIKAIGLDVVDIDRFDRWIQFPLHRLTRIFTPVEIQYCIKNPAKKAERLAARFAVKEAFYKALTTAHITKVPPFLTLCKLIEVCNFPNPYLTVAWDKLLSPSQLTKIELKTHVSISHTSKNAIAVVIIEQ